MLAPTPIALLLLALALPLSAVDYYIAGAAGSDTATGTSPDTAWASPLPLIDRALQAGDSLSFCRGQRIDCGVLISATGTAQQQVTIGAYGTGDAPVLTATNPAASCVLGIDGHHTTISDLSFADLPYSGIWLAPSSHNITVTSCSFSKLAYGVWSSGSAIRILSCHFHDMVMVPNKPGADDDAGAVAVAASGSDTEIAWCVMERCRAPSADYGHDGGAVEVWAEPDRGVHRLNIHHNRISGCNGVVEIGGTTGAAASDITLERNLITDCGQMFLTLHIAGGDSAFGVELGALLLRHNTIVQSSSGWYGIWSSRDGIPLPLRLEHNVIVLSGAKGLSNAAAPNLDGNLIHLTAKATLGLEADANILADPLLSTTFELQAGSPALNAAGSDPGLDLTRTPVPQGPAADIGAFERPVD
ncbi:MAG: right-handed parallel beta-helix repeat-containing protein [Planctomycetota bacterium]|jgi:hypothetical protein|nr:right-handed parallel beta-helix repeat-containing protein [Planctomycetota bacterium]